MRAHRHTPVLRSEIRARALAVLTACAFAVACEQPTATELWAVRDVAPEHARFYLVDRDAGPVAMGGARTRSLQPGFGVTIVQELMLGAERMGRTPGGGLVPMRALRRLEPSAFAGIDVGAATLDFAFVGPDGAALFAQPAQRRPNALLQRHARIRLRRAAAPSGWRAVEGGFAPATALRVPQRSPRPTEVAHAERWLDVELASQTLVAYEGDEPRFATLVSTGIGRPGSDFQTPRGVHRIESKLLFATMDNLEHRNVTPYAYADVPYTQYIGRVALHGVFWHDRFGSEVSHGCINVSLHDARRLFEFTSPRLPSGEPMIAATRSKPGTVIRVR